jgi:hypothetical protein
MAKVRVTIDELRIKIQEVHGDSVKIDESTYKGVSRRARFIDAMFGEFYSTPRSVVAGARNRKFRHYNDIIDISEIKRRILEKHGDTTKIIESTYISATKKATFVDKDYGEWTALVSDVTRKGSCHPKRGAENRKATNIEKYGAENVFASEEIKKRIVARNLENFGVEYPTQSKAVMATMRANNLEKYGVEYTLQDPNVRADIIKTNLKRYGCKATSQNAEVSLKQARSANKACVLVHWKTGQELVCVGSYEKKVVEYLNQNKVNFRWQDKTFIMPDGRRFRPDMYLFSIKKWIEIKGYFWGDAKEKWDWFHNVHINSELWGKDKLKELKIL